MIMGQIGEYRKLSLEEERERFGQKCREAHALDLQANKLIRHLIEAIGRHPAAEADPAVIDAVNAVEDALRQKEGQHDK